jgi:DNA polymerase-1
MLDLDRELRHRGSNARLILQIHDELLLEAPDDEGERLIPIVREIMEGAIALKVPLVVSARTGHNWAEAH